MDRSYPPRYHLSIKLTYIAQPRTGNSVYAGWVDQTVGTNAFRGMAVHEQSFIHLSDKIVVLVVHQNDRFVLEYLCDY